MTKGGYSIYTIHCHTLGQCGAVYRSRLSTHKRSLGTVYNQGDGRDLPGIMIQILNALAGWGEVK